MKRIRYIFLLLLLFVTAAGCASSRSGEVYSRDQARQAQTVQYGMVEAVKPVKIEGTKSVVGPLAGAAAGAVVGSTIGRGTGRTVATVLGGLAGAAGGAAAEEGITRKDGLEITVKLDNGETIAVVQEADVKFMTGDRVRVLKSSDGTTRVSK
ncbi:MAG: glycine zipper 2TM domain-containing protein [Pseudomonadota bacterium]